MAFSKESLRYLGGIRTPHEPSTDVEPLPSAYPDWGKTNDALGMGGGPFAIDLERREFVCGTRYGRVARLQIVEPMEHTNDDVNTFPVAPYATTTMVAISGASKVTNPPVPDTSWFEIMESLQVDGTGQGGFLPVGSDKILGAGTCYYDANGDQIRSTFVARWPAESATEYDPQRTPFVTMNIGDLAQGVIAGYFTPIPEQWRGPLKGDTLQGQAGLPIITRGSAGPSASSFNVADLLAVTSRKHPLEGYPPDHWVSRYTKDLFAEMKKRGVRLTQPPVPATFLVGYPSGHWMPGHPWDNPEADEVYNMGSMITGMAIVGDTLVFAGSHGYGTPCYGEGTSDESQAGMHPDGEMYCYDPASAAKSNHAFPYRTQLWWYPLQDLADVAAGLKEPWSLVPEWCELELPFHEPQYRVNGLAFDPSTKRLYLVAHMCDGYGYEPGPIFYAYEYLGDDVEPPQPEPPPDEDLEAQIERLQKEVLALTLALTAEQQRHAMTKEQVAVDAEMIAEHTAHILSLTTSRQRRP